MDLPYLSDFPTFFTLEMTNPRNRVYTEAVRLVGKAKTEEKAKTGEKGEPAEKGGSAESCAEIKK